MKNFFNKNELKNVFRSRNDKKYANNKTFNNNDEKNNTEEMKDILKKLIKLKEKINEINIIKKQKINLAKSKHNNFTIIDKPNKIKNNLTFRNYKIHNCVNTYKEEIKNYKTEINFNISNKNSNLIKKNKSSNKRTKFKVNISLERTNTEKNNETLFTKKDISKSLDKQLKLYNYHNIVSEHVNYIDKIRDNEFINLFKKFKKSMRKNKKEEINHKKSLVFPSELVNYIIKMKNELVIDKYRNEYLNKIDTYKYNTQKILKAMKIHKNNHFNLKNEIKNEDNSGFNIIKDNIKIRLAQKMNDINEINKSNINNNFINDKVDLLFN